MAVHIEVDIMETMETWLCKMKFGIFFEIHLTANATSIYNQNKFQKSKLDIMMCLGEK